MTEPQMSSMTTYGSMDVSSVRVHGPITQDNHATTKLYVDQAASAVRDSIVSGAGPALDTLKEIESFLQGDATNVSAGLVNQLSTLQAQVSAEVSRASTAEGMLQSDLANEQAIRSAAIVSLQAGLAYETESRGFNVTALQESVAYLESRANTLSGQHTFTNGRIDDEIKRSTDAESALQTQLATSVVQVNARTDGLLDAKLDKAGGVVTGDLNITNGGLLYIGPSWRLAAVGASLEFQYSGDQGESWNVGIPFISA